ncbi:MAG: ABC transporter ATP-binding protein [Pseudomonadota bacterium]
MADPLPAALRLHNVQKTYRGRRGQSDKLALSGIDLEVPRGCVFGLLGPNGAGKSTLINIVAGLVTKTSGAIEICGIDPDRNPRRARRAIGVVPQELNLDAFFTPREALDFQAGLYGVPRRARRTGEILEKVGLADKADAYSRSLSGGMRRRLLIAKALVHDPEVVILDEPTAGVDVELRRQLWDYVGEMHGRGKTIVLTTHYLEEAEALCDVIAIIDDGRVVACEAKDDLLRRLDSKTLTLTLADGLERLPPALAAIGGRLDEAGRVVVDYRPSHLDAGAILDAVRGAGLTIRDLNTAEADLEQVFVRLTGRGR